MFSFQRFTVDDSHSAMKVNTDGVVLGAWARIDGAADILDIGCGSGLIALMIAQRSEREASRISGVEIDVGSVRDASANFSGSPWNERLSIIAGDVFTVGLSDMSFDLIVCNPPFFVENLQSPDSARASARHEGRLGVGSLIALSRRLLRQPDGRLAFVAPSARDSEIEFELIRSRMYPMRRMRMRQRASRPMVRTFYEVGFVDGLCIDSEITISSVGGGYTPDFADLTRGFYLNVD